MRIYNEFGKEVDVKKIERKEQALAEEYILPGDVVLELGARYGSVSCIINSKLNNKKNQVVVEPDQRVWRALKENKEINKCQFHIVEGFISKSKLDLINLDVYHGGYGASCIKNNDTKIPSYTLEDIKNKYNLKFNVLVADCEGGLEYFFEENPDFYKTLRLIIFEADYEENCDYDKIKNKLKSAGFLEKLKGHQNVWLKN